MSKKNNESNEFKELMKTPRGRAVLFFGVYLLFFIFIAIFARVGGTSNINKTYDSGSQLQFSVAGIENGNYKFNYEIVIDGVTTIYSGSSTKSNSSFMLDNVNSYYFNGSNYFTNTNGVWLNVENPYKYYDFIDISNVSLFIERATFISKTEYDSGKNVYNFNISSATINKLLENEDIDIEEVPNELMISADENNNVNEVKYIIDSYCKVKGICTSGMKITLKYEDFGIVDEIESPLE